MIKNILVIEGDFEAGRAIARALETEGYFVFTASSAEVGLMMAKRVKPALILLDPESKGELEFSRKLRSIESMRNIPILLFMEGEREYEHGYAETYGIVNFIKKPVDLSELIAKSKASLEDLPAQQPESPVIRVRESTIWQESGLLSQSKREALSQARSMEPGPEDFSPEEEKSFEDKKTDEEQINIYQAREEPGGLQDGPPDLGGEEKAPQDPGHFVPELRKKKSKRLGNKKLFFILFVLILGLSALFGYFFFFLPGEKAERVLQESPAVPEAAKSIKQEGISNLPDESSTKSKTPESALPNTDQLFAKAEPQKLETEVQDLDKDKKIEKKTLSRSDKRPRIYAVQLGVFGSSANAQKLVRILNKKDYHAYVMEAKKGGKTVYRVLVGKLNSEKDARMLSLKLRNDGFKPVRYWE